MTTDNPYAAPIRETEQPSMLPAKTFLWNWPQSIAIGLVSGVISTVCTVLFFHLFPKFVLLSKLDELILSLIRVLTYYLAGVLILLAFGLPFRGSAGKLRSVTILIIGGCASLLIAELTALSLMSILGQGVALLMNIALRSACLIWFLCWHLKVQTRTKKFVATIAGGTLASMILVPLAGFSLSWSLIAALQVRYVLGNLVETAVAADHSGRDAVRQL